MFTVRRIVNNTCEKYCQYQYQYFFWQYFFAPHHINAINNSNRNRNPNPTHTLDPNLNHVCGIPYIYILRIQSTSEFWDVLQKPGRAPRLYVFRYEQGCGLDSN